MIYILIILYLSCTTYSMEYRGGIKFNKSLYIVEWLVLTLLFGLRYRVGGDTLWYEEEFYTLPSLEVFFSDGFEYYPYQPFWYILNGILKKIWNSFFFFQIVHCAFINGVFFHIFRKYSKIPFTCVSVYFFFLYPYFATEILRESFSVALFALSINSLINKKFLKYYLFSFCAIMFHASAVFLLFIPILYNIFIKQSKRTILFIMLISLVIIMSNVFVSILIERLTGLDIASAGKIMSYSEGAKTMNFNGILMPIIIFTFGLIVLKTVKSMEGSLPESILALVSIYLVFTLCRVTYDQIMQRLANYMMPFFYMSFSYVLYYYITNKRKELKTISACAFFFVSQLHFYFHSNPFYSFKDERISSIYRYYPYHSVFDMQRDAKRERMMYCLDAKLQYEKPFN